MTHRRPPVACLLFLAVLALVASPASAQFQEDPVTWSVELSQDQARPGDQVIVAVVATVTDEPDEAGKHWHFYPRAEEHTGIEIATSITPSGTDLPMRVGAVQWPAPETIINAMGEPQPVYEGVQRFYIPLVIDPEAEPGELALPVAVRFQVCSSFCLAPKTITLSPTIQIVSTDGAAPENRANTDVYAGFDASVWPDLAQGIGLASDANGGAGGDDAGLVLDLYFFEIDLSGGNIAGLAALFLAAIFGGLLLNFTPCVLPVIPIKIMSLSKSGGDRGKTMFLGFVMFAGVISFWLAIGAAIAFVKNFNAVNQLFQQPLFTLAIGIIIAVMAVGMCGLFTIGLPQWVYRINPKHDSVHGSFGFGVMTAVLATPCTAPFMGAAVAASTKLDSSMITLAVFAAVGLGMGGPYLILAAFPKLVDRVPKSGAGSELLKQVMGILMLGAAVFFIGNAVVGLTSDGTRAASRVYWWAVGACILVAGVWLVYKINTLGSSSTKRAVFTVLGVLTILLGGVTGYAMSRPDHTIQWVYYSPDALQAELDKGHVVVIDFTAEWCLNCKTLEKAVLNPTPVSTELARAGIVPMKVDITSSANIDGNALLQEMQRNTIPLLVVMAPDGTIVFKADTYTADQVINAIREAEGRSASRQTALDIRARPWDTAGMDIHAKLAQLGYELPAVTKPVAAYVPAVESGRHLFLSGQLPMKDGQLVATGPVGGEGGPTLEQAQTAAAICALNGIAQIDAALKGEWQRLRRIVRLGVYVAGGPGFTDHHLVANGASELIGKVFGEAGQHVRSAIGVPALPLGASVEVDFVLALD